MSHSDLLFVTNIGFSVFMLYSPSLRDSFITYVNNHHICYRHYQCWQPSWLQPQLLAMILSCHSVHEVNWIRLTFRVIINVSCLLNIQAFTGAFARRVVNRSYKTSEPVPVLFVGRYLFRHYVSTNWLTHMAHN